VHLIVLEKPGSRPKIYIGLGTDWGRGLKSRFNHYDGKTMLLQYVKRALDDGYTIMYKGLLYCCTIPAAGKRFKARALILAIEATFSIVLWATVSGTKDYGMSHLCP